MDVTVMGGYRPNKFKILFSNLVFPVMLMLSKVKVKDKIIKLNELKLLPDKPIIFAGNHSNFRDGPITLMATKKRSYAFIGKQDLTLADRFFFKMIGAVWVDRKDRESMQQAKQTLIGVLRSGQSVMWFPEGTWNLTDNLLMLPMKWGIIDVAQQAGAQIVPIAMDYDRENKNCYVKFGDSLDCSVIDKLTAINYLRDNLAALRWELFERKGIYRRCELDIDECKREMMRAVEEYPPLNWEYEQSIIWWGK